MWTLGIIKKTGSYQYIWFKGSKVWNSDLYSLASNSKNSSPTNREHCYPFVLGKNGWYIQPDIDSDKQGNLGILIIKEITISGEYLPGVLNREADLQSTSAKVSSEWKLNPIELQK